MLKILLVNNGLIINFLHRANNGNTSTVTFSLAFKNIPTLICTQPQSDTSTMPALARFGYDITKTGFKVKEYNSGQLHYIAIGY